MARYGKAGVFGAAVLSFVLATSGVSAQVGGVIQEIVVEGNQRIERASILSYLALSEGRAASPAAVNSG